MSIASLKKRARTGIIEVEHLLKEATYPNDELAKVLDEMIVALEWRAHDAPPNGTLEVPFATWAKVVATYCREGYAGLIRLSSERMPVNFIVGLLEELKTREALATLLLAFRDNVSEPCRDIETAAHVASAVNLMLSFQPAVAVDAVQEIELLGFLRALFLCAETDAQRAIALLAMRGIGDESSAEFAASVSLAHPWHTVPKTVAKHIRKRLRAGTMLTAD